MTAPFYADESITVHRADCLDVLRSDPLGYDYRLGYGPPLFPDASIDAVVTDPPYGLEFMGKDWDAPWKAEGSVVTDPTDVGGFQDGNGGNPYSRSRIRFGIGEGFQEWCEQWAAECLRVLKPGGYLLAFGGTRTWHRLACAIEDAGFEIRDSVADLTGRDSAGLLWIHGQGFPKSLDVSKAIDKRPGVTRHGEFAAHLAERREAAGLSRADVSEQVVGTRTGACWNWEHHQFPEAKWWPALRDLLGLDEETWGPIIAEAERAKTGRHLSGIKTGDAGVGGGGEGQDRRDAPATPAALQWQGWGTALKPAFEPIVVARKPLSGTVAANVLAHGTGAVNIDGCRVGHETRVNPAAGNKPGGASLNMSAVGMPQNAEARTTAGRWPTNVLLGHAAGCEQAGTRVETVGGGANGSSGFVDGYQPGDGFVGAEVASPVWRCVPGCPVGELDRQSGVLVSGANPTRRGSDNFRDAYGEFKGQEECTPARGADAGGASRFFPVFRYEAKAGTAERPRHGDTAHPTVKPLDLMRWLVRLVTPPGGVVLSTRSPGPVPPSRPA